MSRRRKNTFSKAIGHIKSSKFDMIEAAPTNSTSGWMTTTPNRPNPDFVPGNYPHPSGTPDFEADGQADGKDTTGLFQEDGTPRTALPPVTDLSPDRSYLLGPMAAMYYTWAYPWTMIGYIRQADRKFVNLARIDGKLNEWDGESGFNSASWGGQLTLEQANWFKDVEKYGNAGNDPANANYRAFYPGPPSNTPDAFGRYYCTITGEPLDGYSPPVGDPWVPPEQGKMSPDDIFSAIMDRIRQGKKLSEEEKQWLRDQGLDDFADGGNTLSPVSDLVALGLTFAAVKALMPLIIAGGAKFVNFVKSWYNTGRNISVPSEGTARWRELIGNDWKQIGKFSGGKGKWYPRNIKELRQALGIGPKGQETGGILWSFTQGFQQWKD